MAYTSDQLANLEAAIASGTLRVEVNGRMVQYQSVGDLLKLRDVMRAELGTEVPATVRGRGWYPNAVKGYD
jgi:hypothetical protein